MSKNGRHFLLPIWIEDKVKKHETKFCVVCFIGSDDVLDVVVTDDYFFTISEFVENHFVDAKQKGFHIQVVSTSSFIEIMESIKK